MKVNLKVDKVLSNETSQLASYEGTINIKMIKIIIIDITPPKNAINVVSFYLISE
jgi:hypothetical protein